MPDKRTVTAHFEWSSPDARWLPVDATRDADNRVLEYLHPDDQGNSRWLEISWLLKELPDRYRPRIAGNGSCMFVKGRGLGRDFIFDKRYKRGLIAVRSVGLLGQIQREQSIRSDIAATIRQMPCALLGTYQNIEVDHKNGRKNDRRLEDLSLQVLDDFQPLNSTVNAVKREHCRRCEASGKRYDARDRGFRHGWWIGGEAFLSCNGCFWHDIRRFNAEMSRGFKQNEES
jgi:hypothetical protein